jgi:predicted Rdx family selenoprotein
MKKQTGSRWEITVDGKPRTYDHKRELAIEAAQYLKRKNRTPT